MHKVGYAVYCAVQKVRYVVFHDVMFDRIRNSRENKSESKNKKCPPKVNNNAFYKYTSKAAVFVIGHFWETKYFSYSVIFGKNKG